MAWNRSDNDGYHGNDIAWEQFESLRNTKKTKTFACPCCKSLVVSVTEDVDGKTYCTFNCNSRCRLLYLHAGNNSMLAFRMTENMSSHVADGVEVVHHKVLAVCITCDSFRKVVKCKEGCDEIKVQLGCAHSTHLKLLALRDELQEVIS